ncbi:Rieske (2Fe-2S) protein [Janibacter terrae]|uniref:Rieske (2Fe-2S) protein n=1 Tax=Janibacter terrae TaxID=103817 RepID=UPI003805BCC0
MSTTRRTAMSLAATGGAGLLAACGGDGSAAGETGGGATGPVSIPVADVPEGGGVVRDDVVVTQPSAGEFRAFDARCPHQGCAVAAVTAEAIECPCHGSRFDPATGAVTQGPATTGLTARTATVEGVDVTVS